MRADCFKIVSRIAADLGGLHHLVNCVAYFGSESLGASEDDWDKTMKVRDAFFIRSFCPVSLISSCPGQCGWLKLHGAGSSGAHAGSLFGAELQRCQPQQYFCTSNSTKQAGIVGVTQAHRPRGSAEPEPKLFARTEILFFRFRWTYAASKGAINILTKNMALDLAKYKIRVNSVSPGWIWSPEVAKVCKVKYQDLLVLYVHF